jgi:putative oxidoreductase
VAPCLIILGILTRPAAFVLASTMVVVWLLPGMNKTFQLDPTGAWAIENIIFFLAGALVIALTGAGKFSVMRDSAWR